METIKYIIKRLLLAVVILLGVSIIIFALARMMPADFIDQQYSGAVQNGTMSQDDIDRIKELFGLNMPDAFLTLEPGEGSEYSGVTFERTTHSDTYDVEVQSGLTPLAKWYAGTFSADHDRQLRFMQADMAMFTMDGVNVTCSINGRRMTFSSSNITKFPNRTLNLRGDDGNSKVNVDGVWTLRTGNSDITLTLDRGEGRYEEVFVEGTGKEKIDLTFGYRYGGEVQIGVVESQSFEASDDDELVLVEQFVAHESGRYVMDEAGRYDSQKQSGIPGATVTVNGKTFTLAAAYRVATFGDKAGAVFKSYFQWLGNLFKGDLGTSFKYKKPVAKVIMENMGISFIIAFIATILQFVIAIPLGIKAAVHQYGFIDYTVTIFTMIGISLPTFFFGAIVIRVFAVGLGWFEVSGLVSASLPIGASWFTRLGDMLWHMVLPMFVLVVLSIGSLMRYTRTNTLEALNADYVRTARAKGLSEKSVIYKHAFRNTLVPLVTLLAGILPGLFSGAMITETVFGIPGIGKMAYDALVVSDVPFIMGYNMFLAILTVLGTLLSDLMYAVVDPRVKIGK